MAADEAIKFKLLMRKVNCDPGNRERILKEHLQFYYDEAIKDSFWHLVSCFPWGIQQILDSILTQPTVPQIKRLMNDFFPSFSTTTYYRHQYLEYTCVSDPDPLRQIQLFLAKPTVNGMKTMVRLHEEVDCRVKGIVNGHDLRTRFKPQWSKPQFDVSIRSIRYADYDRALAQCKREHYREQLLPDCIGILAYRIYKGGKYVFQEGELKHVAPTMHLSMSRIHRALSEFAHTPRPTRPHGYYRFEL